MGLSSDISQTYRGPGTVVARLMAQGRQEARALLFILIAGLLIFVAQAPWQARVAELDPGGPLEVRLYWSAFFWIMIMPLLMYALAAAIWVVSRVARRSISGYGIRLSLFWAVLASTPVILLMGLVAAFIGAGPQLQIVFFVWVAVFFWFWIAGLFAAERAAA